MQQSANTLAVTSLVLGIVSLATLFSVGVFWVCLPLPLVLGIVAWVLGKNAIAQVDAGLGSQNDRGMAVAGYVMGVISVVLSVLGLCCLGGILVGIIGTGTIPFWAL